MTGHDVSVAFYSFVVGLAIWPMRRLFFPWKCTCGHRHWFASRMMDHIAAKHTREMGK